MKKISTYSQVNPTSSSSFRLVGTDHNCSIRSPNATATRCYVSGKDADIMMPALRWQFPDNVNFWIIDSINRFSFRARRVLRPLFRSLVSQREIRNDFVL